MSTRTRAFVALAAASVAMVMLFWFILTPAAAATRAEADLDPSFGNAGVVTTTIPGTATRLRSVLNGDALAFGVEFSQPVPGPALNIIKAARFLADGQIDQSFAISGVLPLPTDTTAYDADAMGRIYVARLVGSPPATSVLARYSPSGTPDSSFGISGSVVLTASLNGAVAPLKVYGISFDSNGQPLLTGQLESRTFVVRLRVDGTFDAGFGSNGVALAPPNPSAYPESGEAAFAQPDGAIAVIGAEYVVPTRGRRSMFHRFDGAGRVLPSGDGLTTPCQWDVATGNMLSSGQLYILSQGDSLGQACSTPLLFGRLNPDLSLDASFAVMTSQVPIIYTVSKADALYGGAPVSMGPPVVTTDTAMTLYRYTPDAAIDPGFGVNGAATVVITSTYDAISGTVTITRSRAASADVLFSGQILIGGSYQRSGDGREYFALARLIGTPSATSRLYLPFAAN